MQREETVEFNIKAAWHAIARMYNQLGQTRGVTSSTGFVLLNIIQGGKSFQHPF